MYFPFLPPWLLCYKDNKGGKDKGSWEKMLADIHLFWLLRYWNWSGHSDPLKRSLHTHILVQTTLLLIFQFCSFWFPDHLAKLIPINWCIFVPLVISHFRQNDKSMPWSSAYWEDFTSPLSFRVTLEWCCSAATVSFQVVSAHHTEPSIYETYISPL